MSMSLLDNPSIPASKAGPVINFGMCSVKHRDRTKMSKEQREKIVKAIEQKVLEGKHLRKTIHFELVRDGLVTDDKENGDIPHLKASRIAQLILEARVRLNVQLPLAKNRIIDLHNKLVMSRTAREKVDISCRFIALETGCSEEWVRQVLHESGKLTKRSYKKLSK